MKILRRAAIFCCKECYVCGRPPFKYSLKLQNPDHPPTVFFMNLCLSSSRFALQLSDYKVCPVN